MYKTKYNPEEEKKTKASYEIWENVKGNVISYFLAFIGKIVGVVIFFPLFID